MESMEVSTDISVATAAPLTFKEQVCELGDTIRDMLMGIPDPYRVARRMLRRQAQQDGKVLPIYIVVEGIERYCYSNAEGGCWADWHRIIEIRKAWSWKSAIKMIRELQAAYPPPKHNRFSVLGGEDIQFTITHTEDDFPKETTERATYE